MAASRSTKQRSTTGTGHWAGTSRVVRAGGSGGASAGTKAGSSAAGGAKASGGKGARGSRAAQGAAGASRPTRSGPGGSRPRGRRRDEDEDEESTTTAADQGPKECSPCRGKGKLQSNAGGETHEVVCAWCDGTGVEIPGRDAQEHPAERPEPKPAQADGA
ncbi:MAG: hypothetical protein AB7G37_13460 [Solirubrobacteraceae bacterium]